MPTFQTIDPRQVSYRKSYSYLTAAIGPRPIAFASTVDLDGQVNLSPFSFFNVFSGYPPTLVFSPTRRGRDGTNKHTLANILEVPEVVINAVSYSMVEQMSLASAEYDKGVNEFVKSGFTQLPSSRILPPRVGESPVAFECTVDRVIELGDQPGAGNLVIASVQLMHIDERFLDGEDRLDTTKLDLVGRMGGNFYCRAYGEALFEVPKPLSKLGIGVDQLPEAIRNSSILTGNNLGRLGNLEQLPGENEVEAMGDHAEVKELLSRHRDQTRVLYQHLEQLAKDCIEAGNPRDGLRILLFAGRFRSPET